MNVLLVEDDHNLGALLVALLKKEKIKVTWAQDGKEAYKLCYNDSFDIIIMDWMLPGISGIDLCSCLREEEYPGKIIMLTAKDSIEERVAGLNSGADDYLVKPFDIKELIARLEALMRRPVQYVSKDIIYGDYVLKRDNYILEYKQKSIELRPKEFKILELLLRNRGRIITREILLDNVWGVNNDVTDNNLDVHIRFLRKKIEDISQENIICTARGIGYYVK